MIIILLIVVFVGMAFAMKSGTEAAAQAATERDPINRTIHHGETGCMGLLFCAFGVVGVLALIGMAFPGQ